MKNFQESLRKITYTSLTFLALVMLIFSSCEKETIEPDNNTNNGGNGGSGGGGSNITQVDVNGLEQNYINAEGVLKTQLTSTLVEGYESSNEQYTKITYFGEGNTLVTILVKGAELQEGNFSLKKFQLGSNPTATEACVYVATNSTLLDFELASTDRLSIAKNAEGFFVIKMGPTVGIKRNSWDPELTAPISFHIVSNPAKIEFSDSIDGASVSSLYGFATGNHIRSNQPYSSITLSTNDPGQPIGFDFIDYDFSSGNMASTDVNLSQDEISVSDNYNGTAPKGIHISYGSQWNGGLHKQDYSMTQSVNVELTDQYIILKYTDIKLVHVSDPSKTVLISGEIQMAR